MLLIRHTNRQGIQPTPIVHSCRILSHSLARPESDVDSTLLLRSYCLWHNIINTFSLSSHELRYNGIGWFFHTKQSSGVNGVAEVRRKRLDSLKEDILFQGLETEYCTVKYDRCWPTSLNPPPSYSTVLCFHIWFSIFSHARVFATEDNLASADPLCSNWCRWTVIIAAENLRIEIQRLHFY